MTLTSASGSKLNLDALYQIMPSCFTEVRDDKTGKISHKINFTTLRELLDDNAYEGADEEYGFSWVGKNAARREAASSINKTLRPCPEESVDWDNTENLYIEGDNLEVLKLLQKSYLGKIKMIYIDPPYNTGNDFVYRDDFAMSADDYDQQAGNVDELGNRFRKNADSNARFHSDWCSMIYERLLVARALLSNDGGIMIHIDEHEVAMLETMCKEIFGAHNYLGTIVWDKRNPKGAVAGVAYQHESILVFCKNISTFSEQTPFLKEKENASTMISVVNALVHKYNGVTNEVRSEYKDWIKKNSGILSGGELAYSLIDENGLIYQPVSMAAPDRPETRSHRPLIHPTTGKPCPVPAKGWRFTDAKMDEILRLNKVEFGKDETTQPRQKYFLHENMKEAVSSLLYYGGSDNAMDLPFDNPKPVYVAKRLISSIADDSAIILDFFSGSATTAHAVMKLNAEDGGNRKFIMVQLPEVTYEKSEARKAGYNTICEIGKERIRRAGKKIKEEAGEKAANLDTGFRVFKCEDSFMNDVYFAPSELKQEDLFSQIENIKDGTSDLSLLFGCMLDWGVQLSLPLSHFTVAGKTIHNVNDGDLVACFAEDINEEVISAIAELSPLRVVFRDSCFSESAFKMNLFELFKQKCGWSEEQVRDKVRVI